jgi:hypothetical protein
MLCVFSCLRRKRYVYIITAFLLSANDQARPHRSILPYVSAVTAVCGAARYTGIKQGRCPLIGGANMKFWKVVVLVAEATVPILLLARREEPKQAHAPGDPDNIFENELRAD